MREDRKLPVVGVIGVGMVGRALVETFSRYTEVFGYDPKLGLRHWRAGEENLVLTDRPWRELARACDILFLCVPTPMYPDGQQDLSILASVMEELSPELTGRLVVIKSTVAPGTTDWLQVVYPHCQVVFNPEFLRELTANEDFRTQKRVIVGTHQPVPELQDLYDASHPDAASYLTTPLAAELAKYAANCFLATKVSFANEMAQLCEAMAIDYHEVCRLLTSDERIGTSHLAVPGPDGHKGFGGACFPKDLNALIQCAKAHGVDPTVLEAVWEKNKEVRPERDWELLRGRAVS